MRFRTLALALALGFGFMGMAEAKKKVVPARSAKVSHKRSKAAMVKPRKAKKLKVHHRTA